MTITTTRLLAALATSADKADSLIVPDGAKLEKLWGDGEFTEGPAYGPGGCIYFSDIGDSMSALPKIRPWGRRWMSPCEK